ncbi:MAG: biotin transporter BioY [Candidatus Eisenbacteria bacterium]
MNVVATYADLARPADLRLARLFDVAMIVAGSAVVGLAAQFEVRLPFTPVPMTAQPFAVLLVGALLGARRGALAMLTYLGEGVLGLPVFAGGAAGVAPLLGPSGGYLVGFVPAAFVTGALAERGWDRRILSTWAAMALGSTMLFLCGLPWLAQFVGWDKVLAAGFYPFVLGDVIKQVLAALALPGAWKLARAAGWSRE